MYWSAKVYANLAERKFSAVAKFYENLITLEPEIIRHYWLLGLAYFLDKRVYEANAIWHSSINKVDDYEELLLILENEIKNQEKNLEICLELRCHIQKLAPENINNILSIIQLKLQLNILDSEVLKEINIIEKVLSRNIEINTSLLYTVCLEIINKRAEDCFRLVEFALPYIKKEPEFLNNIISISLKLAYQYNKPNLAISYAMAVLESGLADVYLISNLIEFHWLINDFENAFKYIDILKNIFPGKILKIYAYFFTLDLTLKQGNWSNIEDIAIRYIENIQFLLDNELIIDEPLVEQLFVTFASKLPYLRDLPRENRYLQNRLSLHYQKFIEESFNFSKVEISRERKQKKFPKIGYIASTLGRNSVGWLSRWLFKYHNQETYSIYLYLINQNEDDVTEFWFKKNAFKSYNFPLDPLSIARQIQTDQIGILIDLDSLTRPVSCAVMALKPAPIQATWLGFDATGIPNIDYFIVDSYVLPEDAQQYYCEQLWRLPSSYLAVDGFEMATPTLSRKELNIPDDAIVYITAQSGMKRHPETIKLQLQIIKQVPNSYLLIKGVADMETIKNLFLDLAQKNNVELEKLIFLPPTSSEEIHRANMAIADIVLDTYPYNGATTTLEVLWLGIPIVTLVGEQFAARNSYTFMLNAGVEEGIAHSPSEYIEWGIKLGINENLRQNIHWKLLKSKQNSPIWNSRLFTRQMELAYLEMWQKYTECNI